MKKELILCCIINRRSKLLKAAAGLLFVVFTLSSGFAAYKRYNAGNFQTYAGVQTEYAAIFADNANWGLPNTAPAAGDIFLVGTNLSIPMNYTLPAGVNAIVLEGITLSLPNPLTINGTLINLGIVNSTNTFTNNNSIINAASGDLNIPNLNSFSGSTISNNGTIDVTTFTSAGTVTNGGTITSSNTITHSGTMTNNGHISTVNGLANTGSIDTTNGTIAGPVTGTTPTGYYAYTYEWINAAAGDWNTAANWRRLSDGVNVVPLIDGTQAVLIILHKNVTHTGDLTFNAAGANKIMVKLNNNTLTITNRLILSADFTGGAGGNVEFMGKGSSGTGSVVAYGFDSANNQNHNLYLSSGATLIITDTLYGNMNTGNATNIYGDGESALYIPASGANVNWGESKINYLPLGDFLPKPYGSPTTYTMSTSGSVLPGTITVTLDVTGTGDSLVTFNYDVDIVNNNAATAESYTVDGTVLSADTSGLVSVTAAGTPVSIVFNIVSAGAIDPGDGIIVTVRTPDDSMDLGEIRYIQDEITWNGSASSVWNNLANWTGLGSIANLPAANVIIPSGVPNYPDFSTASHVNGITIKNNAQITITNTLTVSNMILEGTGKINSAAGTLNFTGTSSWQALYPSYSPIANISFDAGAVFTPSSDMYVVTSFNNSSGGQVNAGLRTIYAIPSGTLTITGSGTASKTQIGTLSCINQGGKTISFAGSISVSTLKLTGSSALSLLSVGGSGGSIAIPSNQSSGDYLNVAAGAPLISGFIYTAYHSSGTPPAGWVLGDANAFVWTGTTTQWDLPSNWNNGVAPSAAGSAKITIPSSASVFPVLNADVSAADLTIESGASLTLNGRNISCSSTFTNSGTVYSSGGGTISLPAGSAGSWEYTAGTIHTGITFGSLTINGTAASPGSTFSTALVTVGAGAVFNLGNNVTVTNTLTNNGSIVITDYELRFLTYTEGAASAVSIEDGTITSTKAAGPAQTVSRVTFTNGSTATINGGTGGITIASPVYNTTGIITTGAVSLSSGTIGSLNVQSGTASANALTVNTTADVGGALSLSGANTVTGNLTVTGSLMSTSGVLSLGGNLSLPVTASSFDANSGTIRFTGTGDQTVNPGLNGAGVPNTFNTIDIAKTGGSISFTTNPLTAVTLSQGSVNAVGITFEENLTVTNAVAFNTSGIVTLGDNAADIFIFNDGMSHTIAAHTRNTTLYGTLQTSDDLLTLDNLTLGSNSDIESGTALTSINGTTTGSGNDLTVTASAADFVGNVSAIGILTVNGNADFTGTIDTVTTIDINGDAVFGNTITGTGSISVSGTTDINTTTITTTGTQEYTGDVTLGANASLTANNSGSAQTVTFSGNITGASHSLTINDNAVFGDTAGDSVSGVTALTVGGTADFTGSVTGTGTVEVTGTTDINTTTITTTGTQTYTGNVTLGAAAVLTAVNGGTAQNISMGADLDGNTNSLSVNGNFSLTNGTPLVTDLPALTFTGSNAQNFDTGGSEFASVIFQTTNTVTVSTSLEATGLVTIDGSAVSLSGGGTLGSVSIVSGTLSLGAGITVEGNWSNAAAAAALVHNNNTVTFDPSGGIPLVISDATNFYNVTCSDEGGQTLTINGAIEVSNTLTLSGTDPSLLIINGSGSIALSSSQLGGDYIDVTGTLTVTGGIYTATNSSPAGFSNGWNILSGTVVFVWSGNTSTDWDTPGNWNTGIVPAADGTRTVEIPDVSAGSNRFPSLATAINLASLTIAADASVTLNGQNITCAAFTNNGTVYSNGAGTVNLPAGSAGLWEYSAGTVHTSITFGSLVINGMVASPGSAFSTAFVTVDAGAAFNLGNNVTVTNTLTNNGTIAVGNSNYILSFENYTEAITSAVTAGNGTIASTNGTTLQTVSRITFTSGSSTTLSGDAGGLTIASPVYNTTGIITTGTVNLPTGTIASLDVQSGTATVTGNLTLTGDLTVTGTIDADPGTLTFDGTGVQQVNPGTHTIQNMVIAKTGGSITFTNPLTVTTLTQGSANAVGITFNQNLTVTDAAAFNTSGILTLGDNAADVFIFNDGISHTIAAHTRNTTLYGTLQTSSDAVTLDNLTLGANAEIDSGTALTSILGTTTGAAHNLTITGNVDFTGAVSGIGNFDITGNAEFNGAVTGTGSIDISGTADINTTTITTTGAQTYTGDVTLGADAVLTGTLVTFTGQILGATNDLSIIGNAECNDPVSNVGAFYINGNADINDTITGTASLEVTGAAAINTATITTTGNQTYNGNAVLGANTVITANNAGTAQMVRFNGNVDGGGTYSLTINDNAVFGNAALDNVTGITVLEVFGNANFTSSVTAAGTIEVTGTTDINTTAITTTGAQTYTGDVTLGANAVITANNAGTAQTVTFRGNVTGASHSLIINDNAVFGDAAGDSVSGVTAITVGGTADFTGSVTATGTIEVTSTTDINTTTITTTGNQTYNGNAVLGANTVITANNAGTAQMVGFNGNVDGGGTYSLTINDNAVFGNAALDNVTGITVLEVFGNANFTSSVTAAGTIEVTGTTDINTTAITTTGAQTYTGDVTLGANAVITANNAGTAQTVTFRGNVTGASHSLTINDNAVFGDAAGDSVSGVTALTVGVNADFTGSVTGTASIEVTGTTAINTTAITSTGTQTYTGDVTLGVNTVLTAGSAQNISMGSNLTGGGYNLTISGGNFVLSNAAPVVTNLDTLIFTGTNAQSFDPGGAAFANVTITTTNTITLTDDFSATGKVTVNGAGTILDFETNNTGFSQSTGQTFTITNGTVYVGTGEFICGTLTVAGTFTQTGANALTDIQSAEYITGSGAINWDNPDPISLGGYLYLGGCDASNVSFHLKTIEITKDIDLSGEFENLVVPDPFILTVTNTLIVNNTLSNYGSIIIGDQELRFLNYFEDILTCAVSIEDGTITSTRAAGPAQNFTRVTFSNGSTATINGAGGLTLGVTAYNGTGLVTTGTVSIPSGTIASLNVQSGTATVSGNLTMTGDLTVTGTIDADPGTLTFDGTADQTVNPGTHTIQTIDIAKTGGSITFITNPLTVTTLTQGSANAVGITFNQNLTVTDAVVFNTSGTVTFGDADTDVFIFNGGVSHTTGAYTRNTTLYGTLRTSDDAITMDNLTLGSASVIRSLDAAAGAAVAVNGAITGNGNNLTLVSGDAGLTVGGNASDLGTVVLQNAAAAGTVSFSGNFQADALTSYGASHDISFTGSLTEVTNTAVFNNTGLLTLGNAASDVITFTGGITHTAGNTSLGGALASVDQSVSFSALTLSAHSSISTGAAPGGNAVSVGGNITGANCNFSLTGTVITLGGACIALGNVVITNSGVFTLTSAAGITHSADASFTQNGTGLNQLNGSITTSGTGSVSFASDLYLARALNLGGGTGSLTCAADLFINLTPVTDTVTFTSNVQARNIALFNGIVNLAGNCTSVYALQDLILLNGNTASMYNDAVTGITGVYSYHHTGRTEAAPANAGNTAPSSLAAYPASMPDTAVINHAGIYSSSFAPGALNNKTLRTDKNFYANGISFTTSAGNVTLLLPDNNNALNSFAEAYNCTFANTVSNYYAAAAENCTDNGSNSGIAFSRPLFMVNNSAVETYNAGSGTYTVYDDVIRVEFADSISGLPVKIENTNNEIGKAVQYISFDGGTRVFTGTYVDQNCTISTNGYDADGNGIVDDLSVFYIRTNPSVNGSAAQRWNTDATGINPGNEQSTDRGRLGDLPSHRTIVPDIQIAKLLSGVYATLKDEHKNRIAHYTGNPSDPAVPSSAQGARFTATQDRCAPVLNAVLTGQENHTVHDGVSASSQRPYDSHNFIELSYSEPVDIGGLPSDALNCKSSSSFASSSLNDWGGAIVNNTSGFTIAGYISIENGSLVTGSRTADNSSVSLNDTSVHALYRNFSLEAGGVSQTQTHRVRIAIAGWVGPDTITVRSASHYFWPGFIDSAVSPSGTVSRIGNGFIKDRSIAHTGGNVYDAVSTGQHSLPVLSVQSSVSAGSLYGSWDVSPPVIAKYLGINDWKDGNTRKVTEILGLDTDGDTKVDGMEMHFFDNTPQYNDTELFKWVSRRGWITQSTNVNKQNAQDITGGSRSFTDDTLITAQNKTQGGVRTSSLYNSITGFSYANKVSLYDTSVKYFAPDYFTQNITLTAFFRSPENPVTAPERDSLYTAFTFMPADKSLFPLRNYYSLQYKPYTGENTPLSFITDLAGNRMKEQDVETIDRTPPMFSITVGPVGSKELYVVFSKQLLTTGDALSIIPQELELTDVNGNVIDSSINQVDASVPAVLKHDTETGTALIISLKNPIRFEDVLNWRLRVKRETWAMDEFTGQYDYVPRIYDSKVEKNSMIAHHAHTLSDFAVNGLNVLYAFDSKDAVLGQGAYREGEWAVRDFTGTDGNSGRIYTEKDITVAVRVAGLDGEVVPAEKVTLFADIAPNPASLSLTYNENTGNNWTIWLPNLFTALSPEANTSAKALQEIRDESNASLRSFVIPNDPLNPECFNWKDGSDVQMMFTYDVLIDHDANSETPPVPLYMFRLSDPGDISSLALWQFRLSDLQRQRGGVTVLNNVINVMNRETVVVEVDIKRAGNCTVHVMTLDGNIVKTLQRGRLSEGLYYYKWDGTNTGGNPVARGMYFIRVVGPDIDETRKVMAVK